MGLYNTISFENEPSFKPMASDLKVWQTKTLGQPALDHFVVTENGMLTKEHNVWREREGKELDEYATEKTDGTYTSWQEWEDDDTTEYPLNSWKQTIETTRHEPFYYSGTIEVHKSYRGVYHSYDVRFDGCSFEWVEFNEAKELRTNQSNTDLDDE